MRFVKRQGYFTAFVKVGAHPLHTVWVRPKPVSCTPNLDSLIADMSLACYSCTEQAPAGLTQSVWASPASLC